MPPFLDRVRTVRDLSRMRRVPLGADRWVLSPDDRPLPQVEPLDERSWLVRLPGKGRRVVRRVGPEQLGAHLVIDERKLVRNAQGARLQMLRHLNLEHVVWLLGRLRINVVLDVGANRGQYARELRTLGYTGRIVSFEPVPRAARKLEGRAAGDPDWQVRRYALGDADDTLQINVSEGQGRLSSLLPSTDFARSWSASAAVQRLVEVPVRRLDGILDEVLAGVDEPRVYLKLDTQGYDLKAFAGGGDRIADVLAMQSEVSMVPLYEGMPHYTDQLATYEAAGFGLAGMYPVIVDRPTMRVIEFDALLVRPEAARAASTRRPAAS